MAMSNLRSWYYAQLMTMYESWITHSNVATSARRLASRWPSLSLPQVQFEEETTTAETRLDAYKHMVAWGKLCTSAV
eukprot:3130352-Amphidinium_carterae.1